MLLGNSIRTVPLTETLNRIKPYIKKANISRISNITHLDESGLPVYTAIRPLSKSLTLSQGKGNSLDEAKVSALMEALEVYFAENVTPEIYNQTYLESQKFINPNHFGKNIIYHKNYKHNWCKVESFLTKKTFYIPYQFLSIDTTDNHVIIEGSDTTGLASGNNVKEALVHSLFEYIERESYQNKFDKIEMDVEHSLYQNLLEKHQIQLLRYENQFSTYVFGCYLKNKSQSENQITFAGFGCHFDKQIALNRALTEAIQSKLTTISGARDDIDHYAYQKNTVKLPSSNSKIKYSKLKKYTFDSVECILSKLKDQLIALNLDALIYIYHSKKLTFLKSFIIQNKYLVPNEQIND